MKIKQVFVETFFFFLDDFLQNFGNFLKIKKLKIKKIKNLKKLKIILKMLKNFNKNL